MAIIPPDDGLGLPRQKRRTIGLWGAPLSGKTTFLAAMYFAASRGAGGVMVVGEDDESNDFLIESNRLMSVDHEFPPATSAIASYRWIVNVPGRPARAPQPASPPIQFLLDLKDSTGLIHEHRPGPGATGPSLRLSGADPSAGSSRDSEDMMDYLAQCDGLLLLIDPVRELRSADSHEFFHGTMLKIASRWQNGHPGGTTLPHFVAVCITKFDHPDVYGFASKHRFRTYRDDDQYQFPRVHSRDAEAFFLELGKSHASSNADVIRNSLRQYFRPERIQYFVTSSIGFYCDGIRFRDDERDNIIEQPDADPMIRGQIYPINVLEPIVWLGRNIANLPAV